MIAAHRLAPRPATTRRPLPATDDSIAAMSAIDRDVAAQIWHGRAESELRASGAFVHLAGVLDGAGAPAELVALAWRAVDDEYRHAAICLHVANAFAARALPPLRRLPVHAPRHDGASPALRDVLHVVGMSCLNETTGSAFLELCRAGARGALARAALHELLTDEIDHARIGWAFVAGGWVDAATRDALGGWLVRLLDGNLRAWRDRPRRAITPALIEQGCPRWDDVDDAVVAAIGDLLIPGFARVGVDTTAAIAWLEGGCS